MSQFPEWRAGMMVEKMLAMVGWAKRGEMVVVRFVRWKVMLYEEKAVVRMDIYEGSKGEMGWDLSRLDGKG